VVLAVVLTSFITFIYIRGSAIQFEEQKKLLSERIIDQKKFYLKEIISMCIQDIDSNRESYIREILAIQKQLKESGYEVSIEQLYDEKTLMERITIDIRNLRLADNGYVWVNEVLNYEGGENYAIRRIHPNLIETENSFLSTTMEDIKGNTPYLTELNGINKNGSIFFTYWFKKMDSDKIVEKLSYAQHYEDFNWIIAAGVYLDDIELIIKSEEYKIHESLKRTTLISLTISFLITIIATMIAILISGRMKKIFNYYEEKVKKREYSLESLVEERTEEIKTSKALYQNLYNNSPDMYFTASALTGIIEMCNKTLTGIYNSDENKLIGMSFYNLFSPDEKEKIDYALKTFESDGFAEHIELNLMLSKTDSLPVTMNIRALEGSVKPYNLFQANLRDITELVAIHYENVELERQIMSSQKMEAVGTLAAGIAHDFNNLLGAIMSSAQLLQRRIGKDDDKTSQFTEVIMQASRQAADLIKKLMTFTRKEKNVSKSIDLFELIEATIVMLSRTIDKKVSIVFKHEAEQYKIIGNYSAIQSVLINLSINASQAMPNGGKIKIKTENILLTDIECEKIKYNISPGSFIRITVSDSGEGISSDIISKIFEPFFTTKEIGKGTGFGLSTAFRTIEKHKGVINVQSEVGIGSAFQILLPTTDEISLPIGTKSKLIEGKGKILIVDDEKLIRDSLQNLLNSMGYEVLTAENGQQALSIYSQCHKDIDIVLLDMIMPEMNGSDTFYEMKKINEDCKVIVSSGFTDSANIEELKESDLSGIINKPYNDYELSQLIHQVLTVN